jgi:hypothetical protein
MTQNITAKHGINLALAMKGRDRFAYIPRPIPILDVPGERKEARSSEDIVREAIACNLLTPHPKPHARKWGITPEADAMRRQYRLALQRECAQRKRETP